ncbi:MAG: hypothetical protein Q8T11_07150, partial [Elusimicrobiota bacterium]|nr:hypothetical protein [Elusimicrobiota bacterium]
VPAWQEFAYESSFSGFREAKTLAPQAPFRSCQCSFQDVSKPHELGGRMPSNLLDLTSAGPME